MRPFKFATLFFLSFGFGALTTYTAFAAHRSSAEEARVFFDGAVAHYQSVGAETALADFNDPDGEFVKADLYVFVLDDKGVYLASGANPSLVGTAFDEVESAAGEAVFALLSAAADNEQGFGTADYEWLNRQTNQVEKKTSYVQRLDAGLLGVGYYH